MAVTFDQTAANENHRITFINNYSPLIQACNVFRLKSGIETRKVFKLELNAESDSVLNVGDRFLLLNYQLSISGASQGSSTTMRELCPVLFDVNRETIVTDENMVASVCCVAQDHGRDTQMPQPDECSRAIVSKFKALATQAITRIVNEKKSAIDEQNNVERDRWIKEYGEFYNQKIKYYQDEIRRCQGDGEVMLMYSTKENAAYIKLKNEIAGYNGTITRLKRECEEKMAKLCYESNVSISREEVSACYIVVK